MVPHCGSPSRFGSSPLLVLRARSCVDNKWVERLLDRKPEGSFFEDYARLLRFVSGLSAHGLVRLMTVAKVNKRKEAELTR